MKRPVVAALTAMLAFGLAACGAPTPPPTATPAPTATPVPTPTAASSSGSGDAAAVLGAALEQSQEITTYKIELSVTGKGLLDELAQGTPTPADDQEAPLITLNGEFNGEDASFRLGGVVVAVLGSTEGLEVIKVGDKSYIRGPVPLLGAAENKWYVLPADQSSIADPPLSAGQILGAIGGDQSDFSGFQVSGSEQLDGQQCQVLLGDREATLKAFKGLGESGMPIGEEGLESAEMRFWVCDDGYVHQIEATLAGTNPQNNNQPVSLNLAVHITDINGTITITAPADAVELQPGS